MMQVVRVKLNSGLPWHCIVRQVNDSFLPENGSCVFKKETSKVLRWNIALHGSETWTLRKVGKVDQPGKFWNVVLEKDGEDQLGRSCRILPFPPRYRSSILTLPSSLSLLCHMFPHYQVICPKCVIFSSLSAYYMFLLPQFSDLTIRICKKLPFHSETCWNLSILVRKRDLTK